MTGTLITPPITIGWSSLFTPATSKMAPNDPPRFYGQFLLNRTAIASDPWQKIVAAVEDLAKQNYPTELRNNTIRRPYHTEVAGKGWPPEFLCYFNAKAGADFPPNVVDRQVQPVLDQKMIYPGAIVRVSLRLFGWSGKFGTGISFSLGNVQWVGDGARLRGAQSDGAEDFGKLNDDDDELTALSA